MAAVIIGLVLIEYYQVHPAVALLLGFGASILFISLFFANKIFRYSFSILFSLVWALAAFIVGQFIEKSSDTTAWVFSIVAFGISLLAHKRHFSFLKGAERYEYEVQ